MRPLSLSLSPFSLPLLRYPAKAGHVRACSPVRVHARIVRYTTGYRPAARLYATNPIDVCLIPRRESRAPTLLVLNYARGNVTLFSH